MDPALMAVAVSSRMPTGVSPGHQPIAVVLDLVNPVGPGWRMVAS